MLSAYVISRDSDKLPESFDVREFPKHVLKLPTKAALPDSLIIYRLCSTLKECFAYIVKKDTQEQIFTVSIAGLGAESFEKMLEGILDVK